MKQLFHKVLPVLLIVAILLTASHTYALTQPDISVIGDFRAFTGDYKDHAGDDIDQTNNLNYQMNSLELAFSGNLNPYTRGDFYIANHGEGFELEEAYVTFLRGLPLKAQLRAGKFLVDFGRLNTVHPHAYSFMNRPLSHRMYFGYDGFQDIGVNVSFLLPFNFYSKLSLNVLAGELFEGHAHSHEETPADEHTEESGRNSKKPIVSGRLNAFLPLGEQGNIDIGLSGLYGMYQKHEEEEALGEIHTEKLYAKMAAGDVKFKHKWSDYTSFTLQGELIFNKRDILYEDPILMEEMKSDVNNIAFWSAVELQFNKRYNIGVKYDYSPGIFDPQEVTDYGFIPHEDENNTPLGAFDDQNSTTAITVFGGFLLMEETTAIRAAITYKNFNVTDPSLLANNFRLEHDSEYTFAVQIVWSLGPHQPHDF